MAALLGLGIDNVIIEIDGSEMPILDGSAAGFVEAIDQAGIETQAVKNKAMPLGNKTGMLPEERAKLGAWISRQ